MSDKTAMMTYRDECEVLREQVEKLTKERDELVNVTHMGVFNAGDDPKVALNKICCYAQDLGKFFAEDACKGQLAALAEQNARLREALTTCVCAMQDYQAGIGITDMFDRGERLGRNVLLTVEHPGLATPVLNRIRAEAMEEAAKIANEHEGVAWAVSAIRNRKAELEKTNG